jgi:two-component system NtrC family sensor kinase
MAQGNLRHRLEVHSADELGELAASFNKMAADLDRANRELTDWARTLEERVARKTGELRQAQDHLLASEKMAALGKLAATMAHEVNNPLSGILTYTALTLKQLEAAAPDSPERAEMADQLRIIERESRRCGEIMRNLLTFARQAPPQRGSHQLNVLVERALALVHHQLELQGIDLTTRLAPALPPVFCDAGQIQQVALTLLVNAIEATPRGGRVEVSTEQDAEEMAVRLRVRDTGAGIPAEVLPHIFEPFFTTKEDQHRTGLGLAVARSIAEQHDAGLEASSQPGEGTEFIFSLPLAAPELAGVGASEKGERS